MKQRERILLYILLGVFIIVVAFFIGIKEKNRIFGERNVFIYLLDYEEKESVYMVPVRREIPRTNDIEQKIRFAIEYLLKGPEETEKGAGLNTAMPEGATLINVKVEGDTVFLDFSKEIEQGGGTTLMMDRLAQIVYTATQFYPVSKVRLLINGEFIKYFSGEGITDVENPMGRDNFNNYIVKPSTGG
ncbi:MAG TPA: GerMN domain-containing protein [bacterium]|nr:GerMN domain-containing protein [bacterium]HPP29532.1 GerMN domain-containing protein [bacterium]